MSLDILGQTHFIKSVEDIHEALVGAVPGIKFRPPDMGSSRGERFLALDGQADT